MSKYPTLEEIAMIRRNQITKTLANKRNGSDVIAAAINEENERNKLSNYVAIKAPLTLESYMVQQSNVSSNEVNAGN